MTPDQRSNLHADLGALIISECHKAKCKAGDPHEFGRQYCTVCNKACLWTTP